jgi:hypothetical protein
MVTALKPDHDKGAVGTAAQTVSALGLGGFVVQLPGKTTK